MPQLNYRLSLVTAASCVKVAATPPPSHAVFHLPEIKTGQRDYRVACLDAEDGRYVVRCYLRPSAAIEPHAPDAVYPGATLLGRVEGSADAVVADVEVDRHSPTCSRPRSRCDRGSEFALGKLARGSCAPHGRPTRRPTTRSGSLALGPRASACGAS